MKNIYESLGVEPLINAAGPLTVFGGISMHPEVVEAIAVASRSYVDINKLHQSSGRYIAELVGVEAAHVCGCASAGLILMTAACMAGSDQAKIARLPDTSGMKNKFVVQKPHRNPFDHAIHVAGGHIFEIQADPDKLDAALNREDIAAVYFTFAWFCVGEALSLDQVARAAHKRNIPVIVDAAQVPPVEGFAQYINEGADLVVFSGGKSLRGPQTSGVILGRKDLVEACAQNDSPNIKCIGRGMKVSKENIVGLVRAIELYVEKDHDAEMAMWEQRIDFIIAELLQVKSIRAQRKLLTGAGSPIPFVELTWPQNEDSITYLQFVDKLYAGSPPVAVRYVDKSFAGVQYPHIRVSVHTLQTDEEKIVARKIKKLIT